MIQKKMGKGILLLVLVLPFMLLGQTNKGTFRVRRITDKEINDRREGLNDSNVQTLNTFSDTIYVTTKIERSPVYPGGEQKMWDFIKNNFEAANNDEELVRLTFIVSKSGRIKKIRFKENYYKYSSRTAGSKKKNKANLRQIFKGMPRWQPGIDFGIKKKNIKHYFQMRI